jgi:peptidoglycan/xylan/chitin deacetylase (PgdA/CDA1 family)
MRFVSPFLKKVVYPTLSMSGVFRRISASGLAVVTYHGILPAGYKLIDPAFDGNLITAQAFRRQLRRLKAHYNVISPDDVLAWRQGEHPLPARAVALTCDDGLLNHLTDMLPVLQEEGMKCLFFVTGASANEERTMLWYEELFLLLLRAAEIPTLRNSRRVGQPYSFEISSDGITISGELGSREQRRSVWWKSMQRLSQVDTNMRNSFLRAMRKQLASDSERGFDPRSFDTEDEISRRRFALMTCSELRQLASAGMTIGAHTMSHPILSQLPLDLARTEIADCRTRLESALQKKVWAFAYPFGDAQSVTPQVLAIPEESGYRAAFLNYGGGLGTTLLPYALPRIHVTAEMSLAELEAHVSGLYAQLHRAVS